MFDAVLFDLDETLILDEPVSRHAFFITALELTGDESAARPLAEAAEFEAKTLWQSLPTLAADYALRIGHSALEGLWATYDPHIPAEAELDQQMKHLRPEVWARALKTTGLRGDPSALSLRWQALRARFPLFDDADELLARLRPHTRLGIVTNGVAGLQRKKLNGSGVLHWFDAVAISGELGIGKPDPGIFAHIANQLGVASDRCAMVGDNAERDVLGGNKAGMSTAWVDRRLKPRTQTATIEVHSLRELWPWLSAA